MTSFTPQWQRFFYSHYFFGGLRQAVGVLLPALVLSGLLGWAADGFVAAVGAACVAILDQPGGPRRYGINGMFAALCLGSLTTAITGLATSHTLAIWLVVPALCFGFSMLTVYGKHGGLLGFACLLIMTLTLRTPLSPADVMHHTMVSFIGGAFYLIYSAIAHRVLWHREEQQVLSVALYATADYIASRARFYDIHLDLNNSYRQLIRSQATMTDAHQSARDMVLRELPRGTITRNDRLRQGLLNLFVDMINLLDSMVATHTDYDTLRQALPDSDALLFVRDAMHKLANNVSSLALNVARNRHARVRNSVKAELRALEFELQHLREKGLTKNQPEIYSLLVQVLRRLRNMTHQVDRMVDHSVNPMPQDATNLDQANRTLNRFLTRQKWRIGLLTHNLHAQSAQFRYAVRVAIAALLAMVVGTLLTHIPLVQTIDPSMAGHSYWIILTVLIIMKPGFALTRQRNGWRLIGTLIGCGGALLLFSLGLDSTLYLLIMIICSILGYGLIQVNYTLAAMFNTLFVLLAFHFLMPGSNTMVGERLADTVVGCVLALSCSYILPSWERSSLNTLAQVLLQANQAFLRSGLVFAQTCRHGIQGGQPPLEQNEADTQWRLCRKTVHIAFSNFSSAFYRMMDEPVRRQRHVPEFNRLMIQHHTLAAQIAAIIPALTKLDTEPDGIRQALSATENLLAGRQADIPKVIDPDASHADLAYPLRQMIKAAQKINEEMQALNPSLA